MEAFPFSDEEWDPLKPLALSILDAGAAEDDALAASLRLDMLDHLAVLRERHGDHPVLLETIADYTDDDAESAALYRRAAAIAEEHDLPTLSIRVALASTLTDLGEPWAALDELQLCGADAVVGSEDELADWIWRLKWTTGDARDDTETVALYRRAVEIARSHNVPTLSIRIPFVRLLLDIGQTATALAELRACEAELPTADESDRVTWAEFHTEASKAEQHGQQ